MLLVSSLPWSSAQLRVIALCMVAFLIIARCDGLTLTIDTAAMVKGAYDTNSPYFECISDPVYKAVISDDNGHAIHKIFINIVEGLHPDDKLVISGPIEFGAGISAEFSSETGKMVVTGVMTVATAEELISFLKYFPPTYQPLDSVAKRSRLFQIQVENAVGDRSNVVDIPHRMETGENDRGIMHISCSKDLMCDTLSWLLLFLFFSDAGAHELRAGLHLRGFFVRLCTP